MKRPLTDREGEVRELAKKDVESFKTAPEVLPLELASILPRRKPGQRGSQKSPTKESVTIRFSRDVLDFFRESGSGWQTKIDNVLKEWVAHHKRAA